MCKEVIQHVGWVAAVAATTTCKVWSLETHDIESDHTKLV